MSRSENVENNQFLHFLIQISPNFFLKITKNGFFFKQNVNSDLISKTGTILIKDMWQEHWGTEVKVL